MVCLPLGFQSAFDVVYSFAQEILPSTAVAQLENLGEAIHALLSILDIMLRPFVGENIAALLRYFSLAAVIFAISTILSLFSRVVGMAWSIMAWLGHCAMVVVGHGTW